MNITSQELLADGFRRAGTVYADATNRLRVQIDLDLRGFVVYIMVVDQEFMKAGTTGSKKSRFNWRMRSTFSALRNVIAGGAPYLGDPFKQHAPTTILEKHEIELWAQEYSSFELTLQKEKELNDKYQGLWTKEGKRARGRG